MHEQDKTTPHSKKLKCLIMCYTRLLTSGHTHVGIGLHCMTLLDARDVDFGSVLSVELLLDARGYS
jgi:hypothetical protein